MSGTQLCEAMTANTLRLVGNHKAAAAVERQATERGKALALADSQYAQRLNEVGFQIRQIADRAAAERRLALATDLDEALRTSPAAMTPRQSEALLTERGELVKAARAAYGADPPVSAKERIRKWAAGHLEELGRVLRIAIDIPSEVEQILEALYGDKPAEPPLGAANPNVVAALVVRPGSGRDPYVINGAGRRIGRFVPV